MKEEMSYIDSQIIFWEKKHLLESIEKMSADNIDKLWNLMKEQHLLLVSYNKMVKA